MQWQISYVWDTTSSKSTALHAQSAGPLRLSHSPARITGDARLVPLPPRARMASLISATIPCCAPRVASAYVPSTRSGMGTIATRARVLLTLRGGRVKCAHHRSRLTLPTATRHTIKEGAAQLPHSQVLRRGARITT